MLSKNAAERLYIMPVYEETDLERFFNAALKSD